MIDEAKKSMKYKIMKIIPMTLIYIKDFRIFQ